MKAYLSHQFTFATVKKIVNSESKDIIGDKSILVIAQIYRTTGLEIFSVPSSLEEILETEDFIAVDLITKEIVKVIRGSSREQIDALYQSFDQRADEERKKHEATRPRF